MELKKYKLADCLTEFHAGKNISAKEISEGAAYPVFGGNGLRGRTNTYNQDGQYVIIGRQGAYCGNVRYKTGKAFLTEHAIVGQPTDQHNAIYLANKLSLINLSQYQGQSAQPGLSVETLSNIVIELPNKKIQDRVANVLSALDSKIEINKQINDNLPRLDHSSAMVKARRAA